VSAFVSRDIPGRAADSTPRSHPGGTRAAARPEGGVLSKRGFVILVGAPAPASRRPGGNGRIPERETRGHIVTIEDPVNTFTRTRLRRDPPRGRRRLRQLHLALRNTCARRRTSSSSAKSRPGDDGVGIQFAETGTWCWPRCTRTARIRPSTASSISSRGTPRAAADDLSLNIRASSRSVSYRARAAPAGSRPWNHAGVAVISDLIFKARSRRSRRDGPVEPARHEDLRQALFELYEAGVISYEDALRNADSKNELRLKVKLESSGRTRAPKIPFVAADRRGRRRPGVLG